MQKNQFGSTDLKISRLTFGCGAVGGLMTKGDATDQDRAVAWARDNGINHFDTAPSYSVGASEKFGPRRTAFARLQRNPASVIRAAWTHGFFLCFSRLSSIPSKTNT